MKLSAIMIVMLMCFVGFGQTLQNTSSLNSDECAKYKSLYYQYLKQKMYPDAKIFWLRAFHKCGGTKNLNDGFFNNGYVIYNELNKTVPEEDSLRKQELQDSIVWIYEQYIITSPDDHLLKLRFANFLLNNKSNDIKRIDELFIVIDELKEKTPAKYLKLIFRHHIINHYNKAGKEEKNPESFREVKKEVLDNYFRLSKYANTAIDSLNKEENDEKELVPRKSVIKEIEKYKDVNIFLRKYTIQIIRDCQLIEQSLQKQFELLPTDTLKRLERINEHIVLIEKCGCLSTPVYKQYVYESVDLKPSAKGYIGISEIELTNKNTTAAQKALKKALTLAKSEENLNTIHYSMASIYYQNGTYKLAVSSAKKVKGQEKGKAYIIIANSIAATSNSCGESTFERKANYWLANDYYNKAASLGEKIDRNKFSNRWPTSQECFKKNISLNSSYLLKSWNETTIVR